MINPNSDTQMTAVIRQAAEAYAAGEFQAVCMETPGFPGFIDSYQDEIEAAPGMLELVREYAQQLDGLLVACMDDPNIRKAKMSAKQPFLISLPASTITLKGRYRWRTTQ